MKIHQTKEELRQKAEQLAQAQALIVELKRELYLLLSRFDDYISYYTLERNSLERYGALIPRQQMVQWVGCVAHMV